MKTVINRDRIKGEKGKMVKVRMEKSETCRHGNEVLSLGRPSSDARGGQVYVGAHGYSCEPGCVSSSPVVRTVSQHPNCCCTAGYADPHLDFLGAG